MFDQVIDYAGYAVLTEVVFGLTAVQFSVENDSADQILEVSRDGVAIDEELGPQSDWALGGAEDTSIWLRRKSGTGGEHDAHVKANT